jgi:ParB family chromosome partitioning protein
MAKLDDTGIQLALADAYAQGKIRGRKLTLLRRLLAQRALHGGKTRIPHSGGHKFNRRVTAQQLLRIYRREVEKQQVLVKKADFAHTRLLFSVEALRDLMANSVFLELMRAEGLHTLPRALSERMERGAAS